MYLWKFQLPAHKSETSPGSSMKHNTNQRVHSAMCIVHARKYVDITLHDSRRSLSTLTPCMSSCAWYNISFNISHPPVHRCFIFSHRQFYEMHTIFYQRNCYILNLQDYFSVKMSFCTGLKILFAHPEQTFSGWHCVALVEQIFLLKVQVFYFQTESVTEYITYRQVSNISCTLIGNQIVDHSDVVEASPVSAAPTTSCQLHLHSPLNTWHQYTAQRQLHAETRNI